MEAQVSQRPAKRVLSLHVPSLFWESKNRTAQPVKDVPSSSAFNLGYERGMMREADGQSREDSGGKKRFSWFSRFSMNRRAWERREVRSRRCYHQIRNQRE